jgi:hypothetical protein
VVYVLGLSAGKKSAKYTVQARVAADGTSDSCGLVEIQPAVRSRIFLR